MFLRIFVLDSICEPINNSRRCNVGRAPSRLLFKPRVLRMLRLHCLLLIVRYEEAQLSVESGHAGSYNFFYYFLPVFAILFLPSPTLV